MNRSQVHLAVNIALFVGLVGLVATAVVMWLVLPGGRRRGTASFLGLERHAWGTIHLVIGLAFTTLVLVHLVVHRQYIENISWRLGRS